MIYNIVLFLNIDSPVGQNLTEEDNLTQDELKWFLFYTIRWE